MLRVVLISTYELGRQPFGLASPAAWLRAAGAQVTCLDLAVQPLDESAVADADLVACYVPMHTATRLAATVLGRVPALNPRAQLCCYGLYAPMNEAYLRGLGVQTILGGEFEEGLVSLVQRLARDGGQPAGAAQPEPRISLARQRFLVPDRAGLPDLSRYAHLRLGTGTVRVVGATEASRGCLHRCRHCPVVPVYGGHFRVIQREVVLEDVARQVAAGAQHITFGDPDFLNGPGHAMAIVRALHQRFPNLGYDVTIKVEHLLRHAQLLPELRESGCLFITSAVESLDDAVLVRLEKGHTRADVLRAVSLCRAAGLTLAPTFVTFHPWTTPESYLDLLDTLVDHDLVEVVAPVQLAIRLLLPAGSRLLELPEVQERIGTFDAAALCYPWLHADPGVDRLYAETLATVRAGDAGAADRRTIFAHVWALAQRSAGRTHVRALPGATSPALPVPYLSEPWFC